MPTQETPIGSSAHRNLASGTASKRLATFVLENADLIVSEWEAFARTLTPSSTGMTPLALRDHIYQILEFVMNDMASSQTPKEQTQKSLGRKEKSPISTAAETHASLRIAGGFDIEQMVSEYRALRASIIKLWSRTLPIMDADDIIDLIRFNESIDQELTESVSFYMQSTLQSKDLFVGILTHDLRSPVQAIMLSAELLPKFGAISDKQAMLTKGVSESAKRINSLIDNLVDVTRARLGTGLPVKRSKMNIGFVGNLVIDELRVVHPDRKIIANISGDLKGSWDKARIGQIFSNLLGNAIQYSFKDTPIIVTITSAADTVMISFYNDGKPIPPDKIKTIFNPLSRGSDRENQFILPNLGLGLFITDEIVVAHGGTISVTSSEQDGTTFTVKLPRSAPTSALYVV